MNSKWRIRFAALCIVLMLSTTAMGETLPAQTEEVREVSSGEAPAETIVPEETVTPSATEAPTETETPSKTETPAAKSIQSFVNLSQTEWVWQEKPSLEDAVKAFPETLEALLDDGQTVSVKVTWLCGHYDEAAESYAFQAELMSNVYPLNEGVILPTITLRIETPTTLTDGSFVYDINQDGTLTLTAYSGSSSSVSVPESVQGHAVTSVAASAFSGNKTLVQVTLPKTIADMSSGTFKGCTRLEKIEFCDSLENVGSGVFSGCDSLETIQLNITFETTITDGKGYSRKVIDEDGSTRTVRVSFDQAFTDYCVLSGGTWVQDGKLVIPAGHSAKINSGGRIRIAESSQITVLGGLNCAGTAQNNGKIIACAGEVSGVEGTVVRDHDWSDGVCTVCGAQQAVNLKVVCLKDSFERDYDGTSGVDIAADDFTLEGVREGDDVTIAAVNLEFNEKDAGSYLATASFELGGADTNGYHADPAEISIVIHPKEVTVTPKADQSKTYGAKDPSLRATYRGVISGESLTGKLSRESGESVGSYKITIGNLQKLNPNYKIVLADTAFEIKAKSISASGMTLGKIANQRYTGSALAPNVELKDGTTALKAGQDYTLSYTDNIDVGTATVTVTGKGNYTGTRTTTFRIIKVSSGTGGGSLNGGGAVSEENDTQVTSVSTDTLVLNGEDCGSILFDETGEARAFAQSERQIEQDEGIRKVLILTAEPKEEQYGQLTLHLSLDLINKIRAAGYTDVELQVEQAELRVPLDTLYAEYVNESGTLSVEHYELELWMTDEETVEGYQTVMRPVHCAVMALPADAEGEDVLGLLDGVQLRMVPENEPDYANIQYQVLKLRDEEDADLESESASFILDASKIKCSLTPSYAGTYTLAVRTED